MPPSTVPTTTTATRGIATTMPLRRLNSRGVLCMHSQPPKDANRAPTKWTAPPLSPKPLEPLRLSMASDAAQHLDRIEYLDIGDVVVHDNTTYYTVNIYLHQTQSRIPTNHTHHPMITPRKRGPRAPDMQVLHRFSDFCALRQELWEMAQLPHPDYCPHCEGFLYLLIFKVAQPVKWVKTFVHSKELRAKILHKFLLHIINEYRLERPRCRLTCTAHRRLPVLLYEFLFNCA